MFNFFKKRLISDYYSGERETATSLLEVKKEHIFRYNFAKEIIERYFQGKNTIGLDLFCANGYGTFFLAKFLNNTNLVGIDGSKMAIKIANRYYKRQNVVYMNKIFPFNLEKNKFDYIVSFESIEHIENDDKFLKQIYYSLKSSGLLILSTPNEDELPLDKHYNEFHYRQYTYSSIKKILLENKFTIKNVYAQNLFVLDNNGKKFKYLPTKDRIPKEGYNGQHMIIVCVKET